MSIFSQLRAMVQAQANSVAGQWDNPKASLDYSLEKLEDTRREVGRSLVRVSAARQQLKFQQDRTSANIQKYGEQASMALQAGREDLARMALERREDARGRLGELEEQFAKVDEQERVMKDTQAKLETKIAHLRSKNEELKSRYDASQAQLRVREALSGISADLADVGNTVRRVENRIQEMQARADAMDRLVNEGALTNVIGFGEDDIDMQLASLKREQAVEEELQRLRSQPVAE